MWHIIVEVYLSTAGGCKDEESDIHNFYFDFYKYNSWYDGASTYDETPQEALYEADE